MPGGIVTYNGRNEHASELLRQNPIGNRAISGLSGQKSVPE